MTNLQVRVTDERAAESQLLRLVLADGQASVVEFGRKKHNLEEVFLGIFEGDNTEATANSTLQPLAARGWQPGLSNLWHNENNLRWGGRRWLAPALAWLLILNGFVTLVAFLF